MSSSGSGGGSSPQSAACEAAPTSLTSPSGLPSIQEEHVFIVMEENHSYSDVLQQTYMPYLTHLAETYAYAEGYFANTHPSLPNYFWLTTGQGITTSDDFAGPVDSDNVVRELVIAGKTWKDYSECLPSVGYTGGDTGCYVKSHDPFAYLSDVLDSTSEAANLVPFTHLATDIANHDLPNYGFVVPDLEDDAHNCPSGMSTCTTKDKLEAADSWLKTNIGPLLQDPDFNSTGHGLLIITFDESEASDTAMGGGHVAWVVVGPDVKQAYTSNVCFQHQSTVRFMLELLGVTSYPAKSASAPSMRNFLVGN